MLLYIIHLYTDYIVKSERVHHSVRLRLPINPTQKTRACATFSNSGYRAAFRETCWKTVIACTVPLGDTNPDCTLQLRFHKMNKSFFGQ